LCMLSCLVWSYLIWSCLVSALSSFFQQTPVTIAKGSGDIDDWLLAVAKEETHKS
jgi:hypothetical protein